MVIGDVVHENSALGLCHQWLEFAKAINPVDIHSQNQQWCLELPLCSVQVTVHLHIPALRCANHWFGNGRFL